MNLNLLSIGDQVQDQVGNVGRIRRRNDLSFDYPYVVEFVSGTRCYPPDGGVPLAGRACDCLTPISPSRESPQLHDLRNACCKAERDLSDAKQRMHEARLEVALFSRTAIDAGKKLKAACAAHEQESSCSPS
jgi:hypothetical protein